jgi:hypothetical protein
MPKPYDHQISGKLAAEDEHSQSHEEQDENDRDNGNEDVRDHQAPPQTPKEVILNVFRKTVQVGKGHCQKGYPEDKPEQTGRAGSEAVYQP